MSAETNERAVELTIDFAGPSDLSARGFARGVDAELRWWKKEISDEVAKTKANLASGTSADDLAKKYGVATDTLKTWLAGAA